MSSVTPPFLLGDILDEHELINREYKEFCFKTNLFNIYPRRDLDAFISKGVLLRDFNQLIINNIEEYIKVYVPRYISAFHNCNYDNTYVFYIGINDYCEVTGIPFDGNLIMFNTHFNRYIQSVFKENVNDTCCMKVGSEIMKNTIDKDVLSDDYLQGILDKYNEQKQLYHKTYSEYAREKKKWVREIFFFKGKLQDVLNNETIKHEFIEYLAQKNMLKCFPEVFKKSYDIPSDRVRFLKNNPNEMVYWLIMFKDKKVRELTLLKPVDPPIPKILNINYCLLTQLCSMRKRLVDKNISYYTMKITFTCNKHCQNRITYMDPRTKQVRALTRYICPLKQSPRCADIDD